MCARLRSEQSHAGSDRRFPQLVIEAGERCAVAKCEVQIGGMVKLNVYGVQVHKEPMRGFFARWLPRRCRQGCINDELAHPAAAVSDIIANCPALGIWF